MIYNSNAQKRSQMIQPVKLFKLPQDNLNKPKNPIPTPLDTRAFAEKVANLKNKKLFKI